MKRLYLAGPDVFHIDALAIGEELKALCERYGFVGVFPLDAELASDGAAASRKIFDANIAAIGACDGVIANLAPFRGPSADVGTVFEVGYAVALDKPVFAYGADDATYARRVALSNGPLRKTDGRLFASDGMSVEDFGLSDNLMIVEALRARGLDVATGDKRAGFETCLQRAAAYFRKP